MYKDIKVKHEGAFTRYTDVVLVSGDLNAYRIIYTLPEGGQASVFKVTCTRADGKSITDTGEISGRQCVYVMANSMYAVEGELTIRLSVQDGSGASLTVCELAARAVGAGGDALAAENLTPVLDKVLSRQSAAENEINSLLGSFNEFKANTASAVNHRNILRCKNLGTEVTDAQRAAIQNGTFDDLFLGDYWVIDGVTWRIADMDYWYNSGGDDDFLKHHLVIMPDTCLYNHVINDANTTEGGYVGSKMYTEGLNDAKTLINGIFDGMIYQNYDSFSNAVTNGVVSGAAYVHFSVELPSEVMMCGTNRFSAINDGVTVPPIYTISKTQLALFRAAPQFICVRNSYWLRDAASSDRFCYIDAIGNMDRTGASTELGVRPVFGIC